MPKALPHRKGNGQCRDCGMLDPRSAPDSCCRCGVEAMSDLGYPVPRDRDGIPLDPRRMFEVNDWEMWRHAATDMRTGIMQSDRFQVYVGHNDGAPLARPIDDVLAGDWQQATCRGAKALAEQLKARYPQVWVVTTVGCWNAYRPPAE